MLCIQRTFLRNKFVWHAFVIFSFFCLLFLCISIYWVRFTSFERAQVSINTKRSHILIYFGKHFNFYRWIYIYCNCGVGWMNQCMNLKLEKRKKKRKSLKWVLKKAVDRLNLVYGLSSSIQTLFIWPYPYGIK